MHHPGDGETGLGNVCRQDELPGAGVAGSKGVLLRVAGLCGVEREHEEAGSVRVLLT